MIIFLKSKFSILILEAILVVHFEKKICIIWQYGFVISFVSQGVTVSAMLSTWAKWAHPSERSRLSVSGWAGNAKLTISICMVPLILHLSKKSSEVQDRCGTRGGGAGAGGVSAEMSVTSTRIPLLHCVTALIPSLSDFDFQGRPGYRHFATPNQTP